jgi:hypothetical protein
VHSSPYGLPYGLPQWLTLWLIDGYAIAKADADADADADVPVLTSIDRAWSGLWSLAVKSFQDHHHFPNARVVMMMFEGMKST